MTNFYHCALAAFVVCSASCSESNMNDRGTTNVTTATAPTAEAPTTADPTTGEEGGSDASSATGSADLTTDASGAPGSCGDGEVDDGEACDDGNTIDEDTCTSLCRLASCGDGFLQPGEQCDLGASNDNTGECTLDCHVPKCGDAYVQPASGEECDDADPDDTDACLSSCLLPTCGDGFVHAGVEECDDENVADGDGCAKDCGRESRLVFVSSATYTGNLGGVLGADAKCQTLAEAAGLPGVYRAWISDGVNGPIVNFTKSDAAFVRTDGVKIAEGWADLLDGELLAPISITESGTPLPLAGFACGFDQPAVWTNTNPDGSPYDPEWGCDQWTSDSYEWPMSYGLPTETDDAWSLGCTGGGGCQHPSSLYCFQQ